MRFWNAIAKAVDHAQDDSVGRVSVLGGDGNRHNVYVYVSTEKEVNIEKISMPVRDFYAKDWVIDL